MKRLLLAGCIIASLTIVACSGGGAGGTSPLPGGANTPQSKGTLAFSIKVPVSSTQAGSKRPQYVSPSTQSVTFSVNSGTPQVVNLTLGGSTCPLSGGFYICTADASVPAGTNQSLTIDTYDATGGSGNLLSTATTTVTIVANQSNPLTVSLNGVVASVGFSLSPNEVSVSAPETVTLNLVAYDADSNLIVGPGNVQTSGGAALGQGSEIPSMSCTAGTAADCSSFSTGVFSGHGGTITTAYDGTGTAGTVNIIVSLAGYANVSQTLTINPAGTPTATPSPSPSPTPSASPTPTGSPTASPTASPSPSPTPVSALINGNFETGDLTGWYICRAGHAALSAPINPFPAVEPSPNPASGQSTTVDVPAAFGTPIPDPSAVTATVGAPGFTAPHGGTYAAQIGNVLTGTGHYREKGLVGICQDVTVPSSGPGLSLWVWEGGNVGWFGNADTEADIFGPGTTWVTGGTSLAPTSAVLDGKQTAANPTTTLFAETNCYNNANTSGGTSTSDYADCALNNAVLPPSTHGGQWYQKGPYDLSAYAGQTVTILIGVWSSSSSTGYYDYLYADDVVLSSGTTGTVPITVNRPMGAHR